MSVLVLTNLVNMTFAGAVILGTSITGGLSCLEKVAITI